MQLLSYTTPLAATGHGLADVQDLQHYSAKPRLSVVHQTRQLGYSAQTPSSQEKN